MMTADPTGANGAGTPQSHRPKKPSPTTAARTAADPKISAKLSLHNQIANLILESLQTQFNLEDPREAAEAATSVGHLFAALETSFIQTFAGKNVAAMAQLYLGYEKVLMDHLSASITAINREQESGQT